MTSLKVYFVVLKLEEHFQIEVHQSFFTARLVLFEVIANCQV